jgi:hypothetical protein
MINEYGIEILFITALGNRAITLYITVFVGVVRGRNKLSLG